MEVLLDELGDGKVGYAARPVNGGWQSSTPSIGTAFVGYAVLWPGSSTPDGEGSPAAPNEDVAQSFQVTYVGKTAEQADALRDRGRTALAAKSAVKVEGARAVLSVVFRDGQQVRRDDDTTPTVFYAADRFTALTSPSRTPEPDPEP
jgi:hypothetical protein